VDIGAGPGYYLARLLQAHPGAHGVALDSSRPALRRAARAHPEITAVACDIWDALPLEDGVADLLVNVFAPRNPDEMRRVLAPGGTLLVVTPTERHLEELDLLAIHPGKRERLHGDLSAPVDARLVEFALDLAASDVETLIAMGPSAHHDRRAGGPARVTVSVVVEAFRG
jgi:23S rRNA (guanine745-N1)-methyltransferase